MSVFGGAGIVAFLLNVLDGDQPLEDVVVVHHQQLLDAVFLQQRFGFLEGGADADGDEILFRHHVRDRQVEAGFKAQVAIGEDADKLAVLCNRYARDAVTFHQRQRFVDFVRGRHRDRVDDHAALTSLDAIDRFGLQIDRHIAVDEPKSALARQRDGKPRLGHGVHGGADEGNVERDVAGQAGAGVSFGGQDGAVGWDQEDVVKGERFRNRKGEHTS